MIYCQFLIIDVLFNGLELCKIIITNAGEDDIFSHRRTMTQSGILMVTNVGLGYEERFNKIYTFWGIEEAGF